MAKRRGVATNETPRTPWTLARLAGLGAIVLLLIGSARAGGAYLPAFAAWVKELGPWGPLAYIVGYIVATVAFVPGAFLTLAAGAVFGLYEGVLYAFIGESLGGALAFWIARRLARRTIEQHFGDTPRFAAIDRAVARRGGRIVFLLRLSPAIPFNFLNYALGLTSVRFRDYFIASVGMFPGALLYVYYGKVAGDVAALAAGGAVAKDGSYYVLLVVGLVATVVVTSVVARIAQRAMAEATA